MLQLGPVMIATAQLQLQRRSRQLMQEASEKVQVLHGNYCAFEPVKLVPSCFFRSTHPFGKSTRCATGPGTLVDFCTAGFPPTEDVRNAEAKVESS